MKYPVTTDEVNELSSVNREEDGDWPASHHITVHTTRNTMLSIADTHRLTDRDQIIKVTVYRQKLAPPVHSKGAATRNYPNRCPCDLVNKKCSSQ